MTLFPRYYLLGMTRMESTAAKCHITPPTCQRGWQKFKLPGRLSTSPVAQKIQSIFLEKSWGQESMVLETLALLNAGTSTMQYLAKWRGLISGKYRCVYCVATTTPLHHYTNFVVNVRTKNAAYCDLCILVERGRREGFQ